MNLKVGLVSLAGFFTLATPVFAGGQHVGLEADSYGATNGDGTYSRIIRVVDRDIPCWGGTVTFKFVNPEPGDYVMTTEGSASFTFREDGSPYYKNGEKVCGTTAKMGSKVKGERDVTVEVKRGDWFWGPGNAPIIKVDFDGQYHPFSAYNGFGYNPYQDDPAYLLTHSPSPLYSGSNSAPVPKPTNSPQPTPSVKPTTSPSFTPAPSASGNENLQKKVENLQKQLDESKKRQNFLEQRLEALTNWIKSIFPLFR